MLNHQLFQNFKLIKNYEFNHLINILAKYKLIENNKFNYFINILQSTCEEDWWAIFLGFVGWQRDL